MKDLDQLKNDGFFRIGSQQAHSEEKTIIVLGLARSGTSIVAGALSYLGIYMGALAGPPVFEDIHLSTAIEKNDHQRVEKVINDYNESHKVWGYKRPASLTNLSLLHDNCRNPHYIIIFRDIFSIANRNRISVKSDVLKNMHSSLQQYEMILNFLEQKHPKALLVAFDKALNHKESLIAHLVSFCGINTDSKSIQTAIDFITPDPKDYLDSSRITRSKGMIEKVTSESVSGWARYENNERPAEICLIINDKIVARTTAKIFSQRFIDEKNHSKGRCGFVFDNLPLHWNHGLEEVRVKVIDDIQDLENSPYKIKPSDMDEEASEKTGSDGISKDIPCGKPPMDKIGTIYFHVGLHKTGISEIQDALYVNRGVLKENNICYPQNWVKNHSIPLYLMFCDKEKRYTYHVFVGKGLSRSEIDNKRKLYRNSLLDEVRDKNYDTLLFSGEDVSVLTQANISELKSFFELMAPTAKIKIIISLREPIGLVTSRFQGGIKNGKNISDQLFAQVGRTEYQKKVEKFFNVFGKENIIFYKYEDAVKHQYDLGGFFAQLLGVEKEDLPKFQNAKKMNSISDKAIQMISYINDKHPLIKNGKVSEGRTQGDTKPFHKIRGQAFRLSGKTAEKIIDQNTEDMEWLKHNAGIEYPMDISRSEYNKYIIYDQTFFVDIKTIFPGLSELLKKYVYEYMILCDSIVEDKNSKKTIKRIITWINEYTGHTMKMTEPSYSTQPEEIPVIKSVENKMGCHGFF